VEQHGVELDRLEQHRVEQHGLEQHRVEQHRVEQHRLEQHGLELTVTLPLRARALIATVLTCAVALLAVLAWRYAGAGLGPLGALIVLTSLVAAAWSWPLIVYRQQQSAAVHADEGLLLVALLLLPPLGVVALMGVAAGVGQVVHRRPPVKAVLNDAMVVVSAGAAVLVSRLLGISTHGPASARDLGVAVVGVCAFSVLSAVITATVITATSVTSFQRELLDGADLSLLVLGVGCLLTSPVGVAARALPWGVWLLPPVYLGARWVLAGRFDARHDRDRLLGLFDATLAVHKPLAAADVRAELTAAAGSLLRCPVVRLSGEQPGAGELSSSLEVDGGTEWLALSGRSHAEPYDAADQRLLDALTAVGRSALSHAGLYARVQRQGDELAAIMGGLAEGVVAFDADGLPTYVNPAGAALLGTGLDALQQPDPLSARDSLTALARRSLRAKTSLGDEAAIFLRFDGTTFPASYTCAPILEDGKAVGAVLVFRDVSERIAAERELAHNAFHDQLTGLPNRRLFLDRLDQALRRGERSGATHAVLLIDVDRFAVINDNLGHQSGDELLQEIARRIALVARPSDTLARFGGDEFTVLVEEVSGVVAAQRLAAKVLHELTTPVRLTEGREVVATVSIGIATTEGQLTADDVLHDADVAMSQAKAAGVGGVHSYDAVAMRARSAHRFDLEADLRSAIANDELEVYYQPKVDLQSGGMHDVEALIRWPDPRQGMRMPGEFIPVAEESGLILPLGRFVLHQASQQAHVWEGLGARINVAVNLSARQFQDHGLIAQIARALEESELPAERLCLEITESLAMQDLDLTVRTLGQLKDLGVDLAIDDFGTGHSSLNYLKRFPVDEVKIDRSFIRDLVDNPVDSAIVSAIVGLANALGMRTVVEGIEDLAQLDRVRELGCTLAQGYHVSVPKPALQVTQMLMTIPRPRAGHRTIDLTEAEHRG
jgi:diguanylate cyclase (GGDEF)-like protein/PAS domain S-box-containing protein